MIIILGKNVDPNDPALQKYKDAGYEIVKNPFEQTNKSRNKKLFDMKKYLADKYYSLLVKASKGEEE